MVRPYAPDLGCLQCPSSPLIGSCFPGRRIELRIGWLCLFGLDVVGFRQGLISPLKLSLPSLFLLLLAGQFLAPLLPFVGPSTLWQYTLLPQYPQYTRF